jgi:hypothetical protein
MDKTVTVELKRESRKEEQAAEPHKDVKERKRPFQILKLEERIAPGGGNGKHSELLCYQSAKSYKGC